MANRIFLFTLLVFLLSSCQDEKSFVTDNENHPTKRFIKSKKVGWLSMNLFLKPASYLMARQVKEKSMNETDLQDFIEDAESMAYFDLRLSVNSGNGQHIENYRVSSKFEQDQRIQYLAFSMKHDLYLQQGEKRIPCELYHFERNYSITPHRTFVLGFPRKDIDPTEPITFVFDSAYLQTGPLKIQYTAQDIFDSTQINL